jgi:hypothetical protein
MNGVVFTTPGTNSDARSLRRHRIQLFASWRETPDSPPGTGHSGSRIRFAPILSPFCRHSAHMIVRFAQNSLLDRHHTPLSYRKNLRTTMNFVLDSIRA